MVIILDGDLETVADSGQYDFPCQLREEKEILNFFVATKLEGGVVSP